MHSVTVQICQLICRKISYKIKNLTEQKSSWPTKLNIPLRALTQLADRNDSLLIKILFQYPQGFHQETFCGTVLTSISSGKVIRTKD